MEKDERIARIEELVKELATLKQDIKQTTASLDITNRKIIESKTRSEMYSKLEKISGVRISEGASTDSQDSSILRAKLDNSLKKETELEKEILTSFSDETKFPFGIQEPEKTSGSIFFAFRKNFQLDTDTIKSLFELLDFDYPAKFDKVIIDSEGIRVEEADLAQAVDKVVLVLERIRNVAKTLADVLFDENKLSSICEIINSSGKSYKPIFEEIGKNRLRPITTREIANARNMKIEAVASITSMLVQGKNWSGKCSILKRTENGEVLLNSLGRALWYRYEKFCGTPLIIEQKSDNAKSKDLLSFTKN